MYKGQIEIVKQNKETGEVIERITKDNSITLKALFNLLEGIDAISNSSSTRADSESRYIIGNASTSGGSTGFFIGVADIAPTDINEATGNVGLFNVETFRDIALPVSGEDQPRYEENIEDGIFELTFKGLLNPPSSGTRSINLIYLTAPHAQLSGGEGNSWAHSGFATVLESPCEQDETEILTIFYRVSAVKNYKNPDDYMWRGYFASRLWYQAYDEFTNGNRIGESTHNNGGPSPIEHRIFNWSNNTNNLKTLRHILETGSSGARGANSYNLTQLSGVSNFDYDLSDNVGQTWNSIYHYGGAHDYARLGSEMSLGRQSIHTFSYRFAKEDIDPVQNIFYKQSTSGRPYLDSSYMSTGTGSIEVDGSVFTSDYSWEYRINTINNGDVGQTEYNIQRKVVFGYPNREYSDEHRSSKPQMNIPMLRVRSPDDGEMRFLSEPGKHGDPYVSDQSQFIHYMRGIATENDLIPLTFYPNIQTYDERRVISADSHGLSIVNVFEDDYINIDEYSTPELITEELNDYCVDPDNNIWIATLDNGLFKLDSDFTTITPISITHGSLNDNKCISVDFKNNGDIWAFFEGGIARSVDGGDNWDVFDENSSEQFEFIGITDNNWDNVHGIVVDKDHSDDRLAIILYNGNFVWWSRENSDPASDAMDSTVPVDHGSDISIGRVNQTTRAFSVKKWVKHFPQTATFIVSTMDGTTNSVAHNSRWRSIEFGETSLKGTLELPFRDDTLKSKDIIFEEGPNSEFGILIFNGENTAIPTLYDDSLNQAYSFNTSVQISNIVNTAVQTRRHNSVIAYMGQGIFLYTSYDQSFLRVARLLISDDNDGGDTSHIVWEKYGWDDNINEWVLNHTGNKLTHSTSEPLLDGLSISFSNGDTGTSFVDNDFFETYIFKGIHKDNATELSFSVPFHFRPSEQLQDLEESTVPSSSKGLVQDLELNFNTYIDLPEPDTSQTYRHMYQVNGMAGSIESSTSSFNWSRIHAISEIHFQGDFSISFKTHPIGWNNSASLRATLGILPLSDISSFSNGMQMHHLWWFNDREYRAYNGALLSTEEHTSGTTADKDDVYTLERVGTEIHYKINGTTVHTETGVSTDTMVVGVAFDREPSRTFHEMKIDYYTENRRVVEMGNSQNETGVFDPHFATVEAWLDPTTTSVTIDGQPANVHRNPTITPNAGEVTQLAKTGWLVFNDADGGNDITADYQVLYGITPPITP